MASATSPPAIAQKIMTPNQPSLCIKPSAASTSPPPTTATTPSSLLSKEWVVPPRPKPGRKPATDTPPTKRKAQNRAAQRAFRERRAARVGELEEQMKQVEEDHEKEQETLRETVDRLEKEVEQYQAEVSKWVERCRDLEKELALRHTNSSLTDAVPLPGRTITTSNETSHNNTDVPMGCGNCSLESRCQCLDDAFDAMNGGTNPPEPTEHDKRPHSPYPTASIKRIKREPPESLEIDFTAMYASKPPAQQQGPENVTPTSATADPCGFCQDGTPCICAEMAADAEQRQAADTLQTVANSRSLPRISQLSEFTPPPSEGDVSSTNPCAAGPGTCAQCRSDPNSTLFCKSLAASRSLSNPTTLQNGCCGGASSTTGGCCKAVPLTSAPPPPPTRSLRSRTTATATPTTIPATIQPQPTITLTCADAYTTLSRHPAYTRASDDIATWMPRLQASDAQASTSKQPAIPRVGTNLVTDLENRPAMEIDAANVMAVLKEFDRRFGAS